MGERDDARPVGQCEVAGFVVGAAGADLGGDLLEVQPDHRRRRQLLLVGGPRVRGPARHHVVDDRVEGGPPLLRVGHRARDAMDHHGAVVDRVMEGGAGQHQPVDMRHRQTDGQAGVGPAGLPQRPGAGRTVYVEPLAHPAEKRRQDDRCAVTDEAEVADVRLVEYRVDQFPVVGRAIAGTGRDGALGRPVPGRGVRSRALRRCGVRHCVLHCTSA